MQCNKVKLFSAPLPKTVLWCLGVGPCVGRSIGQGAKPSKAGKVSLLLHITIMRCFVFPSCIWPWHFFLLFTFRTADVLSLHLTFLSPPSWLEDQHFNKPHRSGLIWWHLKMLAWDLGSGIWDPYNLRRISCSACGLCLHKPRRFHQSSGISKRRPTVSKTSWCCLILMNVDETLK